MTEADDRLAALFAADLPPARDAQFSTEVLAAVARRRLRHDLLALAGVSFVAASVLAMVWPILWPAVSASAAPLGPSALVVVGVLAMAFLAAGLPVPGLGPAEHDKEFIA
jgi:hypothetical protein